MKEDSEIRIDMKNCEGDDLTMEDSRKMVSEIKGKSILLYSACVICFMLCCMFQSAAADSYMDRVDNFKNNPKWASGVYWDGNQRPKSSSYDASGCCAFTADFAHEVWEGAPNNAHNAGKAFYSSGEITTGDIICIARGDSTHWYAVLERRANGVLWTAEGNVAYHGNGFDNPPTTIRVEYSDSKYTVANPGDDYRSFYIGYHMPGYTYVGGPVFFDTYEVYATGFDSIQANAWLDNSQGKTISQIGVQIGSSKDDVTEAVVTSNVGWTRTHLKYNTMTLFGALASNTTYYIRYFAEVDNKRCYSDWLQATTQKDSITFDTFSVESLSDNNAVFSAWLDNPNAKLLSSVAIQVGTSKSDYTTVVLNGNIQWTRANFKKSLKEVLGHDLEAQTYYYARYYAESEGKIYYGDWYRIQTGKGDIFFDTYNLSEIQDQTAKPEVWMDNQQKGYTVTTIGIECGTSKENTSRGIIASNVRWTRAHLNYWIDQYIGKLQPHTYYYARYFVVASGREYHSTWFEFITQPADVSFGEISAGDISVDDAVVQSSLSNTKGLLLALGAELAEGSNDSVITELETNISVMQRNLCNTLSSAFGPLNDDTEYRMRYYATTVDGKYYYSDWVAFKTLKKVYTPDYILPDDLIAIEDEAFAGLENVIVRIPSNVQYISETAFDKSVIILCASGSDVERLCREFGLTVITDQ